MQRARFGLFSLRFSFLTTLNRLCKTYFHNRPTLFASFRFLETCVYMCDYRYIQMCYFLMLLPPDARKRNAPHALLLQQGILILVADWSPCVPIPYRACAQVGIPMRRGWLGYSRSVAFGYKYLPALA